MSGLTHLVTAIAAALGLAALLWLGRGSLAKELSLLVYGSSLVLMFSSSAAYHLVKSGPQAVQRLRKLDHSAIYLLIAGTYTPICLHFFDGFWRWGMLGIIWGMALIGVTVKLFVIKAPRWITAGVYLIMGWLSIAAIQEMVRAIPVGALAWLFAGGLFFTVGAIIYITQKLDFVPGVFGFHEVWHVFDPGLRESLYRYRRVRRALCRTRLTFIAAGRTNWWEAWIMFGVLALTTIVSRVILIVKHPDLARWLNVIAMQALWVGVFALALWALFRVGLRHVSINGG